jgi:hypothetical protein
MTMATSPLTFIAPKCGDVFVRPDKKKGNGHKITQTFDRPMIVSYFKYTTALQNLTWFDRGYNEVSEVWERVHKMPIVFEGGDSLPFETVLQLVDPKGFLQLKAVLRDEFENHLANMHS